MSVRTVCLCYSVSLKLIARKKRVNLLSNRWMRFKISGSMSEGRTEGDRCRSQGQVYQGEDEAAGWSSDFTTQYSFQPSPMAASFGSKWHWGYDWSKCLHRSASTSGLNCCSFSLKGVIWCFFAASHWRCSGPWGHVVDPEHPGRIIYLISSWGPRGGSCLLLGRWMSKIEEILLNPIASFKLWLWLWIY